MSEKCQSLALENNFVIFDDIFFNPDSENGQNLFSDNHLGLPQTYIFTQIFEIGLNYNLRKPFSGV